MNHIAKNRSWLLALILSLTGFNLTLPQYSEPSLTSLVTNNLDISEKQANGALGAIYAGN